MTIPTEVIMRMATLGLSEDQAKAVADMLTAVEVATVKTSEMVVEASREKTRQRVAKWRANKSGNVTERYVTLRNGSREGNARVEDKTSSIEIEPQKEEKKEGRKRAVRLPENWIAPDDWLAEAVAEGLPPQQAKRASVAMLDWSLSSPNGAKVDWHAAWRGWFRRTIAEQPPPQARAGPPRAPSMSEIFRMVGEQEAANEREERAGGSSARPAIPHLSAVRSG